MIDGQPATAIIPARGGSKGFPGKNLTALDGVSLVGRAVRTASACRFIDRIVGSTDSEAIAVEMRAHGAEVPFLRPDDLASDTAPAADVIAHVIDTLGLRGTFVLLQPTSPLREVEDVDATIERMVDANAPAAVSVSALDKAPHWIFTMEDGGRLAPIMPGPVPTRRQDAAVGYVLNGAVYCCRIEAFLRERTVLCKGVVGHAMPAERSVDIDTAEDLKRAEEMLRSTRR